MRALHKGLIFIGALLAVTALGGVAQAAPEREEVSTIVRVHDLNLEADSGAEALVRRVAQAARRMCRFGGRVSLTERRMERACERAAIEQTIASLERPLVSAAYARMAPSAG